MTTHADHCYSITVYTAKLEVLQCLRALADFAQVIGNKRIVWGNTKKSDWKANGNQVTFHFSKPGYRDDFVVTAQHLLPIDSWREVKRSDANPAQPARR